ncbi:branched-chain amino acid ABC transporter permease [Rariglobus hedericola]|uniref:Branched-chain amino acid ABC transporter permease n=1 Tax=Rariglobus hedericola TaxID=2597822 RepID=A0A556QL49_9BACT|nr:branched-chain amino acid ABC transporter permease [Rariglobus hedericola]TSJ77373.1 branched-chain amino acid ABC transporter permease [Rariglobus hedericola]
MPFPRQHIALLAGIAAALTLSAFGGAFNAYHLDIAMTVGIAIILAVSLNLINGHTGLFSLGHAGFMAIGAYLSATITLFVGPQLTGPAPSAFATQAIFFTALLTGGLCAAFAGILIGLPSLRLKGDYLALVTLGFGEIVRVIFQNIEPLGGALGLYGIHPLTNFAWIYSGVALTIFTVSCLVNSTYGRGFLATHDNEIAARSIGLNTTRYKITAFAVGAFFAGIAGGLFAHLRMTIDPRGFDFSRSIEIILMVILGGMGNTLGVILAAVVLTVLPEVLRPVAEYRMIIYSLLLVILMIARPQGLLNFRPKKAARI